MFSSITKRHMVGFGIVGFGIIGAIMLAGLTIWPLHSAIDPVLAKGWSTPTPRFLWLTLLQALGAVVAVSLVTKA